MPETSPTPPGTLLATDLSARCGRPLECAWQLAEEFPIPLTTWAVPEAPPASGDLFQWFDAAVACKDGALRHPRAIATMRACNRAPWRTA